LNLLDEEKLASRRDIGVLASSPDSRSFAGQGGYLPGECLAVAALQRRSNAQSLGLDTIATIRTATSCHTGYTAQFGSPSSSTQLGVLRDALEKAQLRPADVDYVEATANGLTLTDQVELDALKRLFAGSECAVRVGSLKSYIGHTESASGIAQLANVIMQLNRDAVVPLYQQAPLMPGSDMGDSGVSLVTDHQPWPSATRPLRALLNSYGIGGSYTCLVVEA